VARPIGWVFLALAAVLLSFGIWDVAQPVGPPLPAAQGLLTEGPGWYLQAGYLVLALLLAESCRYVEAEEELSAASAARAQARVAIASAPPVTQWSPRPTASWRMSKRASTNT